MQCASWSSASATMFSLPTVMSSPLWWTNRIPLELYTEVSPFPITQEHPWELLLAFLQDWFSLTLLESFMWSTVLFLDIHCPLFMFSFCCFCFSSSLPIHTIIIQLPTAVLMLLCLTTPYLPHDAIHPYYPSWLAKSCWLSIPSLAISSSYKCHLISHERSECLCLWASASIKITTSSMTYTYSYVCIQIQISLHVCGFHFHWFKWCWFKHIWKKISRIHLHHSRHYTSFRNHLRHIGRCTSIICKYDTMIPLCISGASEKLGIIELSQLYTIIWSSFVSSLTITILYAPGTKRPWWITSQGTF